MSSSYHVCPTNVTFQFDTTFMYLLAVLMFMKLYQVLKIIFYHVFLIIFTRFGILMYLQMLLVYFLDLAWPYFWRLLLFTTVDLGFGLSFVQ